MVARIVSLKFWGFNARFSGLRSRMYVFAIFLSTLITLVLYVVSSSDGLVLHNRVKLREAARLVALVVVWGIVVSAVLKVLLPSPWA